MALKSFICGLSGPRLQEPERDFLTAARPCGIILFARNCDTPEQIRELIGDAKSAIGGDPLVLIDQEGGRVQRLRPPHWRDMPPAAAFGALYAKDATAGLHAAFAGARLIAEELFGLGITVNCAPVLDVPQPGAHDIIGDRAYGTDPDTVAALGRAVVRGYLAGGVLPVIKHVPGHGRAKADSHLALPVIEASADDLAEIDFPPFVVLRDAPLAMTAHVILKALDSERPASISPVIIKQVIRKAMGLTGLIMCDDLGMRALQGPMGARAEAAIAAGCDVALHCSGKLAEMQAVADAVPVLHGAALERFEQAQAALRAPVPFNHEEALSLLDAVRAEQTKIAQR